MDVHPSREADVGGLPVRRALPWHGRRTVGAWCFVDHAGPVGRDGAELMQVGPHPHIGLQTVTWLLEGAVLHTDSIGSEQLIRPGQLNLMTAGRGVSHAESAQASTGIHAAQLWIALPEATRWDEPAFEHHAALPQTAIGDAVATVLLGSLDGARSPARTDTPIVGADLAVDGMADLPLEPTWEHALVVLDGRVEVHGQVLEPGALGYLEPGGERLELRSDGPTRALFLGGEPFDAAPLIWWNFVARTRGEIEAARADWEAGDPRYGEVATPLDRIAAPAIPW